MGAGGHVPPACVSNDGGHFEHDVNWVVALNMA